MVLEINKKDIVVLVFKNPKTNKTKEVGIKLEDLFKHNEDDLIDFLEQLEPCTSSGCNNESQNFCDCPGLYEDYELEKIKYKTSH